ncbi:unnamed protein product [Coffea canephora]|uniref:DH200=94 genomic scaffold, scaffold_299 n=1 Tax=Coffea canephora TaxID=49390 RepID=A0A068VDQ4_COFCA|nr:unnamed protein product [Coffea canephora]
MSICLEDSTCNLSLYQATLLVPWPHFIYHPKDKDMMRLILSSWETLLDSLTQSTPTFMLKEKVAGNNGFACGSIPQHPSTPIQLFGILKGSYSWWTTYQ